MKTIMTLSLFSALFFSSCKYTEAPSAGLAKEMCSCLFVAEQTESYCRLVTKESRILAKWEADYANQSVTARGTNFVSIAKMDDDARFGCSIKTIERDPNTQNRHNARDDR